MKKKLLTLFLVIAAILSLLSTMGLMVSAGTGWYIVKEMKSFSATMKTDGTIVNYNLKFSTDIDRGTRTIVLLSVPEQYSSTLQADTIFHCDDVGPGSYSQYCLPNDSKLYPSYIHSEFYPNTYEGVLSNEITMNIPQSDNISVTFTSMKLYSDNSKGLDTGKSYDVFFVLRNVQDGAKIFRNVGYDKKPVATLLPVTITLKKQNTDGTYTDTTVKTHVVEGSDLTYDTWPVDIIAGSGYFINTAKSTGAGTVVAQSGVGAVSTSDRKAQDVTIYYDIITNNVASVTRDSTTTSYDTLQKAINAVQNGDTVVMTANITETVTIPKDVTVTLDLNGYVLKATAGNRAINVSENAVLTIIDSAPDAKHKFSGSDTASLWTWDETNGTQTVSGGCITGGDVTGRDGSDNRGGAIQLAKANSTLNLNGGNIVGNKGNVGGGISLIGENATLNIDGGNIIHNYCNNNTAGGGGVYAGNVNLQSGSINYNVAGDVGRGGAVYVTTLNMTGGEIVGNHAENGCAGAVLAQNITMTGGRIVGNRAKLYAGAVRIYTNLTFGGTAVIKDNTADDFPDVPYNILVGDGQTLSVSTECPPVAADPNNPDAPYMYIGITSGVKPAKGSPVTITGSNTADYSEFFFSDDAQYSIDVSDNKAVQLCVPSPIKATVDTSADNQYVPTQTGDGDSSGLVENLKATTQDDGSVRVTGYWGATDTSKNLIVKIGSTEIKVDMSDVCEKNFAITVPAKTIGNAASIDVYHEDYETAKKTVTISNDDENDNDNDNVTLSISGSTEGTFKVTVSPNCINIRSVEIEWGTTSKDDITWEYTWNTTKLEWEKTSSGDETCEFGNIVITNKGSVAETITVTCDGENVSLTTDMSGTLATKNGNKDAVNYVSSAVYFSKLVKGENTATVTVTLN